MNKMTNQLISYLNENPKLRNNIEHYKKFIELAERFEELENSVAVDPPLPFCLSAEDEIVKENLKYEKANPALRPKVSQPIKQDSAALREANNIKYFKEAKINKDLAVEKAMDLKKQYDQEEDNQFESVNENQNIVDGRNNKQSYEKLSYWLVPKPSCF